MGLPHLELPHLEATLEPLLKAYMGHVVVLLPIPGLHLASLLGAQFVYPRNGGSGTNHDRSPEVGAGYCAQASVICVLVGHA